MKIEKFAQMVTKQREKAKLTQFDFAVRVGISLMTVHRWEKGLSMPKEDSLDHWVNKIKEACK